MTFLLRESVNTRDKVVFEAPSGGGEYGYSIFQKIDSVDPEESFGRERATTSPGPARDDMDPLARINRALSDSQDLLRLPDYRAEGGSGPCTMETWRRATTFLKKHANWSLQRDGFVVPVPAILPGPEGSIDLHWKTEIYELLVNIPSDSAVRASFYADDFRSHAIKGTFDPACPNRGLISWLMDRVTEALTASAANHGQERQSTL